MESIDPKKSLGQNFLVDNNIKQKIVSELNIEKGDYILEVGPGMGALTKLILKEDVEYLGVEIDKRAILYLNNQFADKLDKYRRIINKDFLDISYKDLQKTRVGLLKVVGNLPYYISSQILFKLFENYTIFDSAIIMLQKEVAVRLSAKPGTKDYGILAIAANLYSQPTKLFDVSPNCFYPKPKVISSVSKLDFTKAKDLNDKEDFMKMIKEAFSMRRKMLSNTLKNYIKTNFPKREREIISNFEVYHNGFFSKRPEQIDLLLFIELYNYFREAK